MPTEPPTTPFHPTLVWRMGRRSTPPLGCHSLRKTSQCSRRRSWILTGMWSPTGPLLPRMGKEIEKSNFTFFYNKAFPIQNPNSGGRPGVVKVRILFRLAEPQARRGGNHISTRPVRGEVQLLEWAGELGKKTLIIKKILFFLIFFAKMSFSIGGDSSNEEESICTVIQ